MIYKFETDDKQEAKQYLYAQDMACSLWNIWYQSGQIFNQLADEEITKEVALTRLEMLINDNTVGADELCQ